MDAILSCGGQKTADGKRFRSGGGILWNILKAREPKAYKEIMAKGREFEVVTDILILHICVSPFLYFFLPSHADDY